MVIRKFRENFDSFQDVWIFGRIFSLISILPLILKLFSIPGIMKTLTPKRNSDYKNPDMTKVQTKIVKYTDFILNRNFSIYKNTCLKRSLVLYHFLRKAGIEVTLCLGVRYVLQGDTSRILNENTGRIPSDKLIGHAWLLYDGRMFLERDEKLTKTYVMTYCFPTESTYNGRNPDARKYV